MLQIMHALSAPRYARCRRHSSSCCARGATSTHADHERLDSDVSQLCELLAPIAGGARTTPDLMTHLGRRSFLLRRGHPRRSRPWPASAPLAHSPSATAAPFHGTHQAGIVTARLDHVAIVSFDATARDRTELAELMRTLTARARLLRPAAPPVAGHRGPPPTPGLLGPAAPGAELTVTLGLGARLFDDRYGLSARQPRRLRPMDTFPDDDLDASRCHGDLLLQLAAPDQDSVLHALRELTRHTRGGMQPRWRIDGFVPPSRPTGAPRNLLGFKDGIANPGLDEADRWIWAGRDEPAWARGGSYQVVRVIRMLVEFWDRVTLGEQERMIGRRRDSGAPLSGSAENDTPDYSNDPIGATIPLDAHIRLANPRTADRTAAGFCGAVTTTTRGTDTQRQPRHGADLHLLPAGPGPAVRGRAEAVGRRAAGRLHLSRRRWLLLRRSRGAGHGRLVRPCAAHRRTALIASHSSPPIQSDLDRGSSSRKSVYPALRQPRKGSKCTLPDRDGASSSQRASRRSPLPGWSPPASPRRADAAKPQRDRSTDTASPIKHLVVLFDENVSYDHYFGTYPKAANTDGTRFYAVSSTPPERQPGDLGHAHQQPEPVLPHPAEQPSRR